MFSMFIPRSRAPALEEQRRDADSAQAFDRAKADAERDERRALHDDTREVVIGRLQAYVSLRRERAREDEALRTERDHSDRMRIVERRLSDAALADEERARSDAEDALERRDDARGSEELHELLKLIGSLLRSAGSLAGSSELRSANVRVQHLIEDALDPEDSRGRYHEVGGSG